MVSLILGLPDWTTKTSFSRTLVRIRTLVSPFENWVSSASAGVIPRFSHTLPVSAGHELPEKMRVPRIVKEKKSLVNSGKRCSGAGFEGRKFSFFNSVRVPRSDSSKSGSNG